MISLSLVEILYLVLIFAVVILTVYLVITLSRFNSVLEDVQRVSHLLSRLVDLVEGLGAKTGPAIGKLISLFEGKSSSAKATEDKKTIKKKK